MELLNRVVIVTGGANGIGRACVIKLVREGAIAVIADIDDINGKELEKNLKGKGKFIKTDVTNPYDVENLKEKILEKYGKIDILINNAAKQTENSFFNMGIEEFKTVIDVNLVGTFICSNIIGQILSDKGKIINMLSVHYNLPRKNKYHYDASKAAVAMLTKEMALELIEKGITVNSISYGACNTPMNKEWINDSQKVENVKSKIPMKWIAEPSEIANFLEIILRELDKYQLILNILRAMALKLTLKYIIEKMM